MLAVDHLVEAISLSKIRARSPTASRSRLANDFVRTLCKRTLAYTTPKRQSEFWALKDVSFSLSRGSALGVIGRNGAGKTTLLRILAGQLPPDSGSVRMLGNAEAMIDLTAGFNMGASGRENIYVRGSLLGRTRREMLHKEDEIIDFAELDDAIDAPISSYSSGMLMRLAFAIIVAARPDILLIDEVLAVGDFRFRQKCLGKIRELRESAAFVLVSHSMADIRNFCDKVIVLHAGEIIFEGTPDDGISYYEEFIDGEARPETRIQRILEPQYIDDGTVLDIEHYWTDTNDHPVSEIGYREAVRLKVSVRFSRALRNPILGVPIWTSQGQYVTGFSTQITKSRFNFNDKELHTLMLEVPARNLNPGDYYSNLGITDGPEFVYRKANPHLRISESGDPYWGAVTLPHSWHQV